MTNLPAAAPAPLPGFVPRDRTLLMGVLNVTPDSFSDGGRWVDPEAAVAHARELIGQGADIIDVGGESTRPGAQSVDVDTEISRVLPVVRALLADGADGTGTAGSRRASLERRRRHCSPSLRRIPVLLRDS